MERSQVLTALKGVRNRKRNFAQSVDLVIGLKDLDMKKPEQQVDFYIALPHGPGKKLKICALVAQELAAEAKNVCDSMILESDFDRFAKNKKDVKKLVQDNDYFLGQANIMPKIATVFGRVLGPKGKMPNLKAGCIVPPKATLGPLYSRLQNTIRVTAKTAPVAHCKVGNEQMKDEQLADNIMAVYEQMLHLLPNGESNIKDAIIKSTMGKPVKLR